MNADNGIGVDEHRWLLLSVLLEKWTVIEQRPALFARNRIMSGVSKPISPEIQYPTLMRLDAAMSGVSPPISPEMGFEN